MSWQAQALVAGTLVIVTKGKYAGHRGAVVKCTDKQVYVDIPEIGEPVRIPQTSVDIEVPSTSVIISPEQLPALKVKNTAIDKARGLSMSEAVPEVTSVPCEVGGRSVGGLTVQEVVLQDPYKEARETCFLKELLGERALILETPLPAGMKSLPKLPEVSFDDNGWHYQLVACKVHDDGLEFWGAPKKCMRLLYAAISGPGLVTIDLQEELEKIADFAALPNGRKVASRLELMQSPTSPDRVFRRHVSEFNMIAEPQSDDSGGCGFIPEAMLIDILGGRAVAKRATSIQVRIFGSALGIFKGVLTKKLHSTCIELPPSMHKVKMSKMPANDNIYLLVTRVHPTETNRQMDKWVKGAEPCKSFEQKKFSDMVARVWSSKGVPSGVIKEYKASCAPGAARKIRSEAWVVGVADPTNVLPEGSVFLTGLTEALIAAGLDHVFITRSPCVKPEDGRLLPVVLERPATMPNNEWTWLLARPLGELIFSNAGERPLPESIAAGDCDGDYYFLCWDSQVLKHLQSHDLGLGESSANTMQRSDGDQNADSDFASAWLAHAHAHMTDAATLAEQMLIGKLYNAMKQKAEVSQKGLADPDARALGEAYLQAIDRGKHGDAIVLPQHLQEELGIDEALFQRMSAQPVAAKATCSRVGWFSGLFGRR